MDTDLVLAELRDKASLDALRAEGAGRLDVERQMTEEHRDDESWSFDGHCQVCRADVVMTCDWISSDGTTPNFRERIFCPRCGLNNRQRFMATVLADDVRRRFDPGTTYLYEQVTVFHQWATACLPGAVVGSEYLGPEHAGGAVIDGIRHEDAMALSFATGSVAAIVANDVYEHVPDIDASLREAVRVLRPGGRLLFSVPFTEAEHTVQRAELRDGEVVHLHPAQYHGNPVDPEGSLVFYDHGWDLLDRCRESGFADAHVLAYWSRRFGYLGEGLQVMFVAAR